MAEDDPKLGAVLLCIAAGRACALPLAHVIETMRPLPLLAEPGLPAFVLGRSTIRGESLPVVDLAVLLGVGPHAGAPHTRFVTLRTVPQRIALAVERVLGVRSFSAQTLRELPSLQSLLGHEVASQQLPWAAALASLLHASHALPSDALAQPLDAV